MKIIELDLAKRYATIKIDSVLDFFHLQNIIEKNDLIKAKTWRRIFIQREDKKIRAKKKFVTLKIKVEKIEFHKHINKLRVTGKIVEAPKEISLGDYHTIEVGLGSILTIEKEEWKENQIKELERAKIRIEFAKPKLIQEFFMHINKSDGLAIYGLEQVKLASQAGAIKVLLIDEEKIAEKEIEEMLREVREKKGEIALVSKKNDLSKNFCNIYGIGAILRFSIV
jgi:stalled ribosome rescue protein Dom34